MKFHFTAPYYTYSENIVEQFLSDYGEIFCDKWLLLCSNYKWFLIVYRQITVVVSRLS